MRLPIIAVLAASASTGLAVTPAAPRCPDGWAPFPNTGGISSSCVAAAPFINDGSSTPDDACAALHVGAHAASVSADAFGSLGDDASATSSFLSALTSVVSLKDSAAILGCVQSRYTSDEGETVVEWSWSDGTDAGNLDAESEDSLWGLAWSADTGAAIHPHLRYVMV
jgi:hypothetical protein